MAQPRCKTEVCAYQQNQSGSQCETKWAMLVPSIQLH